MKKSCSDSQEKRNNLPEIGCFTQCAYAYGLSERCQRTFFLIQASEKNETSHMYSSAACEASHSHGKNEAGWHLRQWFSSKPYSLLDVCQFSVGASGEDDMEVKNILWKDRERGKNINHHYRLCVFMFVCVLIRFSMYMKQLASVGTLNLVANSNSWLGIKGCPICPATALL